MTTKLFRFTTKTPVGSSIRDFVDWYEANSQAEAKACYDEDLHRYGLDNVQTEIAECNPKTLKPLNP